MPVVAHVERYRVCTTAVAKCWRASGAKLQVNSLSLISNSRMAREPRTLISAGVVDVVVRDNHGDARSVEDVIQYLTEEGFPEIARLLVVENPAAILENGEMTDCPPILLKTGCVACAAGVLEVDPGCQNGLLHACSRYKVSPNTQNRPLVAPAQRAPLSPVPALLQATGVRSASLIQRTYLEDA